MTIRDLRLRQFRSWARLDLDCDGRPVALHGPNGAGKTNILEAVSMLAPGRGMRAATPAEQARRGADLGWQVSARIAGHEVLTRARPGALREVLLDETPAPQLALGRLMRVIWLTPAMDRLWLDAPEQRRRFLDRVTLSLIPDHAETALAYDRALRERNRLLRDAVRDPGWYRAIEQQMARSGAALARNRADAIARLMAAQDRANPAFPAARLWVVPGEAAADDPDPDAIARRLAEGRARDMAAGRTLTGPHRADLGATWGPDDMPAALSSTGEQKALLLSLVLANARALAAEGPVLLLDEVAAHLDADRREALYALILELGIAAFLTGTGPELFAPLRDRARILRVTREGDLSRIA